MKITIDYDTCELHGDCILEAPEVFDIDDDADVVVLLDDSPEPALREKVQSAARKCPVAAIRVED